MAPPRDLGRDPGLTARITLTFFLLGALYVVLIGAPSRKKVSVIRAVRPGSRPRSLGGAMSFLS